MRCRAPTGLVAVAAALALAGCPAPVKSPAPPEPLPAAAYAHYIRGRALAFEGDAAAAARELARAAAAAPDEPEIRVAYIEALLGAGRKRDARAVAERARTRWPERADVQLISGTVYRRLGLLPAAAAALERALRLDRDSEAVVLELGSTYVAMERPERAAAIYRQLIARRPNGARPRFRLLKLLVGAGRFAEAEPVATELVELRPGDVKVRVLHAQVLGGLGRRDAALSTLREGFARTGRLEVGERLFVALLDAGERAAALEVLDDVAAGDPDADARARLGELYLRLGHAARALAIAGDSGGGAALSRTRALALAELGRHGAAATAAREAGDEAGTWSVTFAAEMLARADRTGEALALLEAAGAHAHHDIARARVLEIAGDVAAARSAFAAAARRWPGNEDVRFWRAAFELRAGNHRAAVALAEPLRRADPGSWGLSNFVGYALADGNLELGRARRLLERALRSAPDEPTVLDSMGWLQLRRGDFGAAARYLYRAHRLAPADAEILYHLGVLEVALGRQVAARRRLARARRRAADAWLRARIDAELAARAP
jgi:tetratricopeptide (TPR) repeat protein